MIVVLFGPPAAGKTTLADGLRDRLADRGYDFRRASSDEFSRRTYEQLYERVADGGDWIVDGTFYEMAWRERFRSLDGVTFVHVTADEDTCLARNRTREDPISERGVHVVYAEFDPPRDAVTIDTDEQTAAEALDRLESIVVEWLREAEE